MDNEIQNLEGIFRVEVQFKNSTPHFNQTMLEFLKQQPYPDTKFEEMLVHIEGWRELMGEEPLYGLKLKSTDDVIIKSLDKGTCIIYIVWRSHSKYEELLNSFLKELNKDLKEKWKRSEYSQIKYNKLNLSKKEKIDVYPTFIDKKKPSIDHNNKIDYLNFQKENSKHYKTDLVIFTGLSILLLIISLFVWRSSIPIDFFYVVLGILISTVLNSIYLYIKYKGTSHYSINVSSFRISRDPHILNKEIKKPEEYQDPE